MLGSILGGLGKAVGGLIGGIVTLGSALLGIIDAVGDSFMNLYDTGINLARGAQQGGDGLARLVSAAADASMSVGAFADFIAENSRVSVAIGVEAMAGLSDSVRRALIPMGSLALTTSEANEYIGDYLELQRGLGVLDTMSRLEQTQSQTEYLVMLSLIHI